MSRHNFMPLLVIVVLVVAEAEEQQIRGKWCLVRLAAPPGSSWRRMSGGHWRVAVAQLLRLMRQHSLELREGRPPLHSAPPHMLVTACQDRKWQGWAQLPEKASVSHALQDDDSSSFACVVERLQEGFLALFGMLRWSPEQKEGAPPREYMYNYCGRDLPVTGRPVSSKRMYKETIRLEQELLR